QAELVAEPEHGRRDVAEVFRDQLQLPQLGLGGAERLRPRTAAPAAVPCRFVALRDRPVGDEAAEVVDPRRIDELERAPEPLDPPAVALDTVRVPVVERVAPVLAGASERVGRRAGDLARPEELRPGAM